jgi:curli biogenesis system outer membrane secretion channel CsgG
MHNLNFNLRPLALCLAFILCPALGAQEHQRTVAVLEPTGNRTVTELQKRTVLGALEEYVTNSKQYGLVDRAATNKVLGEMGFQRGGLVDGSSVKSLGKMMGADFVFVADLLREDGYFNANIRLIDATTGETSAASETIDKDGPMDVKKMIGDLAGRLLKVESPEQIRERERRERERGEREARAGRSASAQAAGRIADPSDRPRVAIVEIPMAAGSAAGWAGWGRLDEVRASNVLRDLFTTELVRQGAGKIRLLERAQIDEVRKEQAFWQSDSVDAAETASVGRLLGARYIVTGKITRFATRIGTAGTGSVGNVVAAAAGAALPPGTLPPNADLSVTAKKTSFTARLDMRVIDVETGEIVAALTEEGSASGVGVKVLGMGTEIVYDETMVGQVFEPLVKKLAPKLIGQLLAAAG